MKQRRRPSQRPQHRGKQKARPSLLASVLAAPPAIRRCIGPRPWYDALQSSNPALMKEIDDLIDAFWRGDVASQCPTNVLLREMLHQKVPEIRHVKRTTLANYINSRKPTQ